MSGIQNLLAFVGPSLSNRNSPMLVDAIQVRVDNTPNTHTGTVLLTHIENKYSS